MTERDFLIAPSILAADFARLGEEIRAVEQAGADWIHVDVMDGHFVPNLTIGPPVVKALAGVAARPLDVHLMIENPDRYVGDFVAAGAHTVTVHVEAATHVHRTVHLIRDLGAKAGVSLNPGTPVEALRAILPDVDLVLLMSVNPGFGGQSFIEASIERARSLRAELDRIGSSAVLEIDGGIGVSNIRRVAEAGVQAFVAGSAIFGTHDYVTTIAAMRAELSKVGGVAA